MSSATYDSARPETQETGPWTVAALACALVLAAFLRFDALGLHSIWFDEAASWLQSRDGLTDMIRRTARDNYPPLHNLVLWATIKLFGDGEIALRAPSAVFSTLTVAAVFLLGRVLAGPRAGLVAAMILAMMPLEIEHGHNARMYALFSLTVTLYLWSVVRYMRDPSAAGAALGGIALLAMLYTHVYGFFVFAGVSIAWNALYLFRRHIPPAAYWRWFLWHTAAVILFVPWFIVLIDRAGEVAAWRPWLAYPDLQHLTATLLELFPLPVLALAGLVAAGALVRLPFARNASPATMRAIAVIATGVAVPAVIGYVLSVTINPMLISRYMIFAIPAGVAVTAAALVRLPLPPVIPWLATGAVMAGLAGPAMNAIREPGFHRDWRGLVAVWQEMRAQGDGLIIYPRWATQAFSYYAPDADVINRPLYIEEALRPVDFEGRVWIAVRKDDPAFADAIEAAYREAGYESETALAFHRLQLLALKRR